MCQARATTTYSRSFSTRGSATIAFSSTCCELYRQAGLEARVMARSPSVAEMFTHIHFVRLIFLSEDAPEFATQLPPREWLNEGNPDRIADELDGSAKAVRDAVETCIQRGQEMKIHYDHPLLYLQHMIWHEGYHHGQMKLALKMSGSPFDDEEIGPLTWGIWLDKTPRT